MSQGSNFSAKECLPYICERELAIERQQCCWYRNDNRLILSKELNETRRSLAGKSKLNLKEERPEKVTLCAALGKHRVVQSVINPP